MTNSFELRALFRADSALRTRYLIASPERVASNEELLQGYELAGGTVYTDAYAWSREWLGRERPWTVARRVVDALADFVEAPSQARAEHLQSIANEEAGSAAPVGVIVDYKQVAMRALVYRWLLGDPEAAIDVARIAYSRVQVAGYGTAESHAIYATLFECLDDAQAPAGESERPPHAGEGNPRSLAREFAMGHLRTIARLQPEWDFVRDELHPVDLSVLGSERVEPEEVDDPRDWERNGIVRDAPRPVQARRPQVPAPSMEVIPDLGNLSGSAKMGRESSISGRGTTPRSEWAPLSTVRIPLVHGLDVPAVAATLRRESPWASPVTDRMLATQVGRPFVRYPHTLVVGTQGAGKSAWARRLGEASGLHVVVYSCGGVADAALGGTSRQWSTGRVNFPLQVIRSAGHANPLIVLDEFEKSGNSHNGRLVDVLLSMLEPEGSSRYLDPYLECPVDLSAVSFIATANSLDGLSAPLLDRFDVIRMPEPGAEHLGDLARRIVDRIREERGLSPEWMPDLDEGSELQLIGRYWPGGSIRLLRKLVEAALSARDTHSPRH